MNIEHAAYQALLALQDVKTIEDKNIRYALSQLEYSLEYCNQSKNQTKELLLEFANSSSFNKFKLIGRVNTSGTELMEWCEDAYNFSNMCSNLNDLKTYKDGEYIRRTYTLEELPDVIDNALSWYNRNKHYFNSTPLHILGIE